MEIAELYEKYFFKIRYYVYTMIENWHDAEDITQEIFLSYMLIDKTDKVMNGSVNYLYRSARNKGIDYTRRKQTYYDYYNTSIAEGEPYEEKHIDKENEQHETDLYNKVRRGIERLPEGRYKTMLVQHMINGKPVKFLASEFNIAVRTVYRLEQHAITRLKERFGIN
jgi:RNA polymerase sigma factor (sigma-70 family)